MRFCSGGGDPGVGEDGRTVDEGSGTGTGAGAAAGIGIGAGAGGEDGTGRGESALVGTGGDVGTDVDANVSAGWGRSVGEFAIRTVCSLVSNILTFGRKDHPHCSGVDVPAILSFVAFAPAKKPCMNSALIPSCPMSLKTSPSLSNPCPCKSAIRDDHVGSMFFEGSSPPVADIPT